MKNYQSSSAFPEMPDSLQDDLMREADRPPITAAMEDERADALLTNLGLTWNDFDSGVPSLDIGAAEAWIARAARRKCKKIVSVDHRKMKIWRLPSDIDFRLADVRNLPLDDGSVGLTIAHAAPPVTLMKNRQDMNSIIMEIVRVLRPGAELRFGGFDRRRASAMNIFGLFAKKHEIEAKDEKIVDRVRRRTADHLLQQFGATYHEATAEGFYFRLKKEEKTH